MRDASFAVTGSKLFNAMPTDIREFGGSLDTFKRKLDSFLRGIEDKPPLPGYRDAAVGNSLIQQIAHVRAQNL